MLIAFATSTLLGTQHLVVRQAVEKEAALDAALDALDYAPIVAQTGPVHIAAVDLVNSRLLLAVDDPSAANASNAGASAGVPVHFVTGSSAVPDD